MGFTIIVVNTMTIIIITGGCCKNVWLQEVWVKHQSLKVCDPRHYTYKTGFLAGPPPLKNAVKNIQTAWSQKVGGWKTRPETGNALFQQYANELQLNEMIMQHAANQHLFRRNEALKRTSIPSQCVTSLTCRSRYE